MPSSDHTLPSVYDERLRKKSLPLRPTTLTRDFLALGLELLDRLYCLPQDVRVVCAAQSAVRGKNDELHLLRLALGQERMLRTLDTAGKVRDHGEHLAGVGPRRDHAFLRAPQLCRSHHLHGLGDLLGLLDARDLSFNVS